MRKPFNIKGHTTVYGGISEDGVCRDYYTNESKKYELREVNGKVILVKVGRKVR